MSTMTWNEKTGGIAGATTPERLPAAMERWNELVKATVPPERLLVWDPADGWEPLWFLEVDVPAGGVPHLNDTLAFKEGIVGGSLAVINEWWHQRDRPSESLHGTALS